MVVYIFGSIAGASREGSRHKKCHRISRCGVSKTPPVFHAVVVTSTTPYIRLAGETHAPSKGVIRTSYLTCAFVGDTMDDDSFGHVGNVQVKTVLKRTTMQCAGSISGARGRGQGGALVVNESTFEESASSTQTVADASRNTSWRTRRGTPLSGGLYTTSREHSPPPTAMRLPRVRFCGDNQPYPGEFASHHKRECRWLERSSYACGGERPRRLLCAIRVRREKQVSSNTQHAFAN